jgi:hypothetical protein
VCLEAPTSTDDHEVCRGITESEPWSRGAEPLGGRSRCGDVASSSARSWSGLTTSKLVLLRVANHEALWRHSGTEVCSGVTVCGCEQRLYITKKCRYTVSYSALARNVTIDEVKRLNNLSSAKNHYTAEVKARPVRFSLKFIGVKATV